MSNLTQEEQKITFREISRYEDAAFREIAQFITTYSWFEGYPVDPLEETRQADYIVGAYAGETLVGFGSVSRVASPDGMDNGSWWLADAVVLPAFRRKGLYRHLYEDRMQWLSEKPGRILTCTEVPLIDAFMLAHGWYKIRDTQDEQGNACRVYEFPRP